MSTFDSTKNSLRDLLKEICDGKIQLPDFQRGWIWDDDHIRDLLVSIARSFPVGAVMLLRTGENTKFQTRPIEGLENTSAAETTPERLILDGQQRLTTLTQALALSSPVNTRTNQKKKIKRHYYFDIRKALDDPQSLDQAIIGVDADKKARANFGRDVILDLSTREHECEKLYFPCDQTMDYTEWGKSLYKIAQSEEYGLYMDFCSQVLDIFRHYQLPVIELHKETPKEAVCLVFEKVNTGGVPLSVFELLTASYAAEGYNLRDDWYGSSIRNKESRHKRLAEDMLLSNIKAADFATDFLQGIALLHTYELKQDDIKAGKRDKQVQPVSAKRAEILNLPLSAWKNWADKLENGFKLAEKFLKKESFYSHRELPYRTQVIPLAAVLTQLGETWLEPRIYNKLTQWFWCGVLGELYGSTIETRIANDYEELLEWFESEESIPRTISEANFQIDRLDTLRSRQSAAYKALNVLVLREGAQDWFWKEGIQKLDIDEVALDIHHIFPKSWCEKNGIHWKSYDSILNKTSLSYKANRKIGGNAPSIYLRKIQTEEQVQLTDEQMNELLSSHAIDPTLLRSDDYENFIEDRRQKLSALITKAMGKPVISQSIESAEYDDDEDVNDASDET